jgi:hypothetical protein
MTTDFDPRKSRVWGIFADNDRVQTGVLASCAAEALSLELRNYGIKDPPWWAPFPFGRFKLVDRNTGKVIARSHDDEYLARRAERLAYLDRLRCVMEREIQEEEQF